MFTRAFRFCRKWKPLLTASLLTFTLSLKKIGFQQPKFDLSDLPDQALTILKSQRMLKKIIEKQVCQSKSIVEGKLFFVEVSQQRQDGLPNKTYTIAIGRVRGKLYAVLAHCPYKQPLSDQTTQSNNFRQAIIFNQKLYCPHHGCAFDIRSGTVEYGPSNENLARFFVEQKQGKVKLYYPAVIPISVMPKYQWRDLNDLRKVVILGGDHNATMGVIDGFKKYNYGGQITIINSEDFDLPYRQDLLHRKLMNFKKYFQGQKVVLKPEQIQRQLEKRVYSKLQFHNQLWYQSFGIQFLFNSQPYRIINKRFYPYVKFMQGTKIEFDGLIFTTGSVPRFTRIQNIIQGNTFEQHPSTYTKYMLPNIFAPHCNKNQHKRMLKYLNMYPVRNMFVLGLNVESLEFIAEMYREFPEVKIKVMDFNKDNSVNEMFGPEIGAEIVKEFVDRGVEFYVKFQQIPEFMNSLGSLRSSQQIDFLSLQQSDKPRTKKVTPQTITNSITVKLDQTTKFSADCAILFPNNTFGNNQKIKNAKFSDIDYSKKNDTILVDTHGKTDTKRMYAAGSCVTQDFFFTRNKIHTLNPNVAYQQGVTCAFNVNALNVPYHYIPFQMHRFFDRTILFAGDRKNFDQMYIMGDVKSWDFLAFYALNDQIQAVTATPSRQREFQLIRQCFRLDCQPNLASLVQQQWTLPLLYKLVRKLDKSGCYKDQIQTLRPEMNIRDVIWMDREKGSFVTNSEEDDDEKNIQVDQRGYTTESF